MAPFFIASSEAIPDTGADASVRETDVGIGGTISSRVDAVSCRGPIVPSWSHRYCRSRKKENPLEAGSTRREEPASLEPLRVRSGVIGTQPACPQTPALTSESSM
jgi:hypothetical protein